MTDSERTKQENKSSNRVSCMIILAIANFILAIASLCRILSAASVVNNRIARYSQPVEPIPIPAFTDELIGGITSYFCWGLTILSIIFLGFWIYQKIKFS
jgi:hypothetical protein